MRAPYLGGTSEARPIVESAISHGDITTVTGDVLTATETEEKPKFTGRLLIIMDKDASPMTAARKLKDMAGIRTAMMSDFSALQYAESKIRDAGALIYEDLGVALVGAEEDQMSSLMAMNDFVMVPELVMYAMAHPAPAQQQWNIEAVRAHESQFSGIDVKLAILDTGIDLTHPHYSTRNIMHKAFDGTTIQDNNGHGTHCSGTAAGYLDEQGVRYGVAYDAHLHVGKVLGDNGRGAQSWILDGMTWARQEKCRVISMSLGSMTYSGPHLEVYERAAQAAMRDGAVVVAAVGNESRRPNMTNPVGCPANCRSVVGVGAVDSGKAIAWFSNRKMSTLPGHEVDLVAPGVDIRSTWSRSALEHPGLYRTISGTSMATPAVAGLVALLWEEFPQYTPQQIIQVLFSRAVPLPLPAEDVGRGMASAF